MGSVEVARFLRVLAQRHRAVPSTQNQASTAHAGRVIPRRDAGSDTYIDGCDASMAGPIYGSGPCSWNVCDCASMMWT